MLKLRKYSDWTQKSMLQFQNKNTRSCNTNTRAFADCTMIYTQQKRFCNKKLMTYITNCLTTNTFAKTAHSFAAIATTCKKKMRL